MTQVFFHVGRVSRRRNPTPHCGPVSDYAFANPTYTGPERGVKRSWHFSPAGVLLRDPYAKMRGSVHVGRVSRRRNPTPHRGPVSDYASLIRPTGTWGRDEGTASGHGHTGRTSRGVSIRETKQQTWRHRQGSTGAVGLYHRRAFRRALVRPALSHDPAAREGGVASQPRPGGVSEHHAGAYHRAHEPACGVYGRPAGAPSTRDSVLGPACLRRSIPHLRTGPRLPVRTGRGGAGGSRHCALASHGHGVAVQPLPGAPRHGIRRPWHGRHRERHAHAAGGGDPVGPVSMASDSWHCSFSLRCCLGIPLWRGLRGIFDVAGASLRSRRRTVVGPAESSCEIPTSSAWHWSTAS